MSSWTKKAGGGEGSYDLWPEGNHPARCVGLIDLGTHTETFQGTSKDAHKIYLAWELVEEGIVVGREFTFSLHEKAALRAWLKSWRGKDIPDGEEFDLSKVVGAACNVTITHTKKGDRTYAAVSSISAPLRGQTIPAPKHTPVCYALPDGPESSLPDWLPWSYGQSLPDKIAQSHERQARKAEAGDAAEPVGATESDSVPF